MNLIQQTLGVTGLDEGSIFSGKRAEIFRISSLKEVGKLITAKNSKMPSYNSGLALAA